MGIDHQIQVEYLTGMIRSNTENDDATSARLAERVVAGAAWLDERWPSWEYAVNLDKLSMADHCNCVLGQIVGEYRACDNHEWDAEWFGNTDNPRIAENLGLRKVAETAGVTLSRQEAIDRGFHLTLPGELRDTSDEFAGLNEAWRSLILERVDPAPF